MSITQATPSSDIFVIILILAAVYLYKLVFSIGKISKARIHLFDTISHILCVYGKLKMLLFNDYF